MSSPLDGLSALQLRARLAARGVPHRDLYERSALAARLSSLLGSDAQQQQQQQQEQGHHHQLQLQAQGQHGVHQAVKAGEASVLLPWLGGVGKEAGGLPQARTRQAPPNATPLSPRPSPRRKAGRRHARRGSMVALQLESEAAAAVGEAHTDAPERAVHPIVANAPRRRGTLLPGMLHPPQLSPARQAMAPPLPHAGGRGGAMAALAAAAKVASGLAAAPIPAGASLCAGCNEVIALGGAHLLACGRKYHKGCFRCSHCAVSLTDGFVRHEGKAYCREDYVELFAPRCACGCRRPVHGRRVQALGVTWEPDHFRCADCAAPLAGSGEGGAAPPPQFARRPDVAGVSGSGKGPAVCMPCYRRRYAEKCAVCDDPLVNVRVLRNGWGQVACERHASEGGAAAGAAGGRPFECFCCARFVPQSSPQAAGGRSLCGQCHTGALCRRPAAAQAAALRQALGEVIEFLAASAGVYIDAAAVPTELTSLERLIELMGGGAVRESEGAGAGGNAAGDWMAPRRFHAPDRTRVRHVEPHHHSPGAAGVALFGDVANVVARTGKAGPDAPLSPEKKPPEAVQPRRGAPLGTSLAPPWAAETAGVSLRSARKTLRAQPIGLERFDRFSGGAARYTDPGAFVISPQRFPPYGQAGTRAAMASSTVPSCGYRQLSKASPCLGLTLTQTDSECGVVVAKRVRAVYLWEGLGDEHARAVLAHEVGHAHFFLQHFPTMAPVDEEGLCELMCSLWLQHRAKEAPLGKGIVTMAKLRLEAMLASQDPVYGIGLRRARAALARRGGRLGVLLDDCKRAGCIPLN